MKPAKNGTIKRKEVNYDIKEFLKLATCKLGGVRTENCLSQTSTSHLKRNLQRTSSTFVLDPFLNSCTKWSSKLTRTNVGFTAMRHCQMRTSASDFQLSIINSGGIWKSIWLWPQYIERFIEKLKDKKNGTSRQKWFNQLMQLQEGILNVSIIDKKCSFFSEGKQVWD